VYKLKNFIEDPNITIGKSGARAERFGIIGEKWKELT
jgi:hypothetical protein